MSTSKQSAGPDPGKSAFVGRRVAPGQGALDDFTYSIIETPIPPKPVSAAKPASSPGAGERRGEVRRRTHLRDGVLAEGRGRIVGDCRILNRSELGAQLQLTRETPLPKSFLLTDPATKTRFRATLIWQKGAEAGVSLAPAP